VRHSGFGDESAKAGHYAVLVARVPTSRVDEARTFARSLSKRGARRLHMTKEHDDYRKAVLKKILDRDLFSVWVAHGHGAEPVIRPRCLQRLVVDQQAVSLDRLVLESRESRNHQDRQILAGCGLPHVHLQPHEDPLLWVADALAWSFTHGGSRRRAIEAIAVQVRDVTGS